jgi:oxygen-independent coproporphyrinogen-3 oxidase
VPPASPSQNLGLYIHFPFCAYKCGYCDFNSWVEKSEEPQKLWLEALKKEIAFWKTRGLDSFQIDTLFMGGGTPSLLKEKYFFELEDFLKKNLFFSPQLEWTVEANPETISPFLLQNLEKIGVNRLSIGIQSFHEKYLHRLERGATPESNKKALSCVAENWKGRWSLDLMFGLPEQNFQDWEADLLQALSFGSKHISVYQLTLTTEKSKSWKQPLEEELLKYFRFTREILNDRGLIPYEISNFAVSGEEARHNLKYWKAEPFLALGPGAYSLLPQALFDLHREGYGAHLKNPSKMSDWQKFLMNPIAHGKFEKRDAKIHAVELFLVGLRLEKGIEKNLFPRDFDFSFLDSIRDLVENNTSRVKATEKGREILDTTILKAVQAMELSSNFNFL